MHRVSRSVSAAVGLALLASGASAQFTTIGIRERTPAPNVPIVTESSLNIGRVLSRLDSTAARFERSAERTASNAIARIRDLDRRDAPLERILIVAAQAKASLEAQNAQLIFDLARIESGGQGTIERAEARALQRNAASLIDAESRAVRRNEPSFIDFDPRRAEVRSPRRSEASFIDFDSLRDDLEDRVDDLSADGDLLVQELCDEILDEVPEVVVVPVP